MSQRHRKQPGHTDANTLQRDDQMEISKSFKCCPAKTAKYKNMSKWGKYSIVNAENSVKESFAF
jgi:hypothetical protein